LYVLCDVLQYRDVRFFKRRFNAQKHIGHAANNTKLAKGLQYVILEQTDRL
jgi:hypothetical protein